MSLLDIRDSNRGRRNMDEENQRMKSVASATVGGATAGAGVAYGIPLAANLVGFGASGISAGSMAASSMSYVAQLTGGRIVSGSLISVMQSIGAIGLAGASIASLVAAGAAAGLTYGIFNAKKNIWIIAMIDEDGKLDISRYPGKEIALESYHRNDNAKIMYNPDRIEVLTIGLEEQLVAIRQTLIKYSLNPGSLWYTAIMHNDGSIRLSSFESEPDGESSYTECDGSKILYNPDHEEVKVAGAPRSLNRIREYIFKNGFLCKS
uniref:AlNc14C203G8742 protein n=1 Tax=Albugo laibachii Nc14 TaxID=890382 RepID=F0W7W3_9STRA|nr:AlNc14C32G2914 [Albugo laibachii Nc14]CCA23691.1 AlNc14C203G8742 [Albugo laibachii Nc14]|eukprot:CCA23691.1 AlNc14C203G8742 [Albugo laibachii Nc14]